MFTLLLTFFTGSNTLTGILNNFYKLDKQLGTFIESENGTIKLKEDRVRDLQVEIDSHHFDLAEAWNIRENVKKFLNK